MSLPRQIVRFGVVGVANTAVYYACYLVLHLVLPYVVAHLIAWFVAMVFSFWMNCVFTYRVRPTWRKFAVYPLTNVPNVMMTTAGVVLLVEWLGMSERWAPLVAGILAIPATFVVTRFILVGRATGQLEPRVVKETDPGAVGSNSQSP